MLYHRWRPLAPPKGGKAYRFRHLRATFGTYISHMSIWALHCCDTVSHTPVAFQERLSEGMPESDPDLSAWHHRAAPLSLFAPMDEPDLPVPSISKPLEIPHVRRWWRGPGPRSMCAPCFTPFSGLPKISVMRGQGRGHGGDLYALLLARELDVDSVAP